MVLTRRSVGLVGAPRVGPRKAGEEADSAIPKKWVPLTIVP